LKAGSVYNYIKIRIHTATDASGSSLFTTLIAGTVGLILLIITAQSVTAIILWIQLNALANHAAVLAASDLTNGVANAIKTADSSIYASGITGVHQGDISWYIHGQTVQLTLHHSTAFLVATSSIVAHASALVN
jgi:hypothetical protein